jgi:hypothetical protein
MAMSRSVRTAAWVATALLLVAALAYLRDPPWLLQVTSGFGTWQEDETGRPCRWTTRSHASLYVARDAALVTLPLRLGLARADGLPVEADLAIDGRVFSTIVLDDPLRWIPVTFTLPSRLSPRRAVRVEIVVRRLLRRGNLGVQVGEPIIRPRSGGTAPVVPAGHR